MKKNNFAPWWEDMKWGLGIVAAGGVTIAIALQNEDKLNLFTLAGLVVVVMGLSLFKRGKTRIYGKIVEKKAIHSLRIPRDWDVKPNMLVPGLGDIDLVLESTDAQRWAIEIKSQQNIQLKKSWFSTPKILHQDRPLTPNPIEQMERNAEFISATGVLWYPKASTQKRYRLRSGHWVVLGTRKQLEKAIGVRSWFNPF